MIPHRGLDERPNTLSVQNTPEPRLSKHHTQGGPWDEVQGVCGLRGRSYRGTQGPPCVPLVQGVLLAEACGRGAGTSTGWGIFAWLPPGFNLTKITLLDFPSLVNILFLPSFQN